LIAHGKSIFENALMDPGSLVKIEHSEDRNWEGFSYVALHVYEKKTGSPIPAGIRENVEIGGEEWSEEGDDLEKKYPQLCKKWGY